LSGAVIWDAGDIKVFGGAVTNPAVAGGKVLFGTFGQDASKTWTAKSISAYDLKNGKLAWTKTLSSGVVASPSVTSNGQVLVGTADAVYALNLADGSQVWSEPVDAGVSDPPGGIAISGSVAYFASYNGTVYAFKLDSKEKSDWPLRGGDANTGTRE
jgi:outer membrane protein assembly factor BamB